MPEIVGLSPPPPLPFEQAINIDNARRYKIDNFFIEKTSDLETSDLE